MPTASTGPARKGAAVGHLVLFVLGLGAGPVGPVGPVGLEVGPGLAALQSAGQDVVVSGPSQKLSPQHCLLTADTVQATIGGWAVIGLGMGPGFVGELEMGLGLAGTGAPPAGGSGEALGEAGGEPSAAGLDALQSAGQDVVVSGPSQKLSPQQLLLTAETVQAATGGWAVIGLGMGPEFVGELELGLGLAGTGAPPAGGGGEALGEAGGEPSADGLEDGLLLPKAGLKEV